LYASLPITYLVPTGRAGASVGGFARTFVHFLDSLAKWNTDSVKQMRHYRGRRPVGQIASM
jgi:hypothetical protein